jgi:glycerophosphoryl diester phosphodiesterase
MLKIIAHRGASKEAPENTLSAIKMALEIGVDYIELDVHLSLDEVPLVIHDARLGRTVKGNVLQKVAHLTLEELKTLDAGSWFAPHFSQERISTLQEVLSLDRQSTGLMIEVKKGYTPTETLVSSIGRTLLKQPHSIMENVCIGSLYFPILAEFRNQFPFIPLIGIVEKENLLPDFQQLNLTRYAFWYKLINPYLNKKLQDEGAQVWAFTVDDVKIAKFLHSIHTNGIITNDPRKLKLALT